VPDFGVGVRSPASSVKAVASSNTVEGPFFIASLQYALLRICARVALLERRGADRSAAGLDGDRMAPGLTLKAAREDLSIAFDRNWT